MSKPKNDKEPKNETSPEAKADETPKAEVKAEVKPEVRPEPKPEPPPQPTAPARLELGCGRSPIEGFAHHDRIAHSEHVDVAWDLRMRPWPFVARHVNGPIAGIGIDPDVVGLAEGRGLTGSKRFETHPEEFPQGILDEILALDVFEHVSNDVKFWLDECWRLLKPGGKLDMRLPAWDNPNSFRDITHLGRTYHAQSFDYVDPDKELQQQFGSIYFAESPKWWKVVDVRRENGDFRFVLEKRA